MCPQTFLFKLASVDSLCVTGPAEKHSFQAETRQLLDIVAKSLYSEKEVSFLFPSLTLFLTTVIAMLSVLSRVQFVHSCVSLVFCLAMSCWGPMGGAPWHILDATTPGQNSFLTFCCVQQEHM